MAVRTPRIDAPALVEYAVGDPSELTPDASIEMSAFHDVDLTDRDLMGLSLDECELRAAILDGADLTAARVVASRFSRLQAPRMLVPRSSISSLVLEHSRLGALDLFESRIRGMVIEDCKIDLLNMRGADIRDMAFRNCTIGEIDLADATVTRLAFDECSVGAIDVHRATLSDADLRGARLGTLRHLEGLNGAVIDPEQLISFAGLFAAHLGVHVE